MRSGRILACMSLGAMAFAAVGCSSPAAPTPAFNDLTGEAANPASAYPAGPYGVGIGSVIPNFDFVGFPNATADNTALKPISLADFYNPHAFDKSYQPASPAEDDRLFPSTSGYALAGKAKPTVLLIDTASVWCGPCNQEAQTLLPFKHDLYSACGGEFFLNLHDSNTPGTTATQQNLKNWTKLYKVNYPAVIDPEYKLDPVFVVTAFPNNTIIDTTTMKIVHGLAGEAVPGICSDMQTICGTDADLATCTANSLNCGGLAACPSGACTQLDLWSIFESHLDKSRAGCTVK